MGDGSGLLMREFLSWVASRRRTYAESMDAWRTSCPRLSVWEDALIDGLIEVGGTSNDALVTLTPRGQAMLGAGHEARTATA